MKIVNLRLYNNYIIINLNDNSGFYLKCKCDQPLFRISNKNNVFFLYRIMICRKSSNYQKDLVTEEPEIQETDQ